jgi:Zn-dependent oligopeptidase
VISYTSLSPEHVGSAVEITLEEAKKSLLDIYNIEDQNRTYYNTVLAVDDIYNEIFRVYGPVYLMANVNPAEDIRNKANEGIAAFSKFFNELSLDEQLYKSLKEYAKTEEAKI